MARAWALRYEDYADDPDKPDFFQGWQSSLVEVGVVLAAVEDESLVVLVLCCADYGMGTIRLTRRTAGYVLDNNADAIQTLHIYDHTKWSVVPYKVLSPLESIWVHNIPCNVICLMPTGPNRPLLVHVIEVGKLKGLTLFDLTSLLKSLGKAVSSGRPTRKELQLELIQHYYPEKTDDERMALLGLGPKKKPTESERLMEHHDKDLAFRVSAEALADIRMGMCRDHDGMLKEIQRHKEGAAKSARRGNSASSGQNQGGAGKRRRTEARQSSNEDATSDASAHHVDDNGSATSEESVQTNEEADAPLPGDVGRSLVVGPDDADELMGPDSSSDSDSSSSVPSPWLPLALPLGVGGGLVETNPTTSTTDALPRAIHPDFVSTDNKPLTKVAVDGWLRTLLPANADKLGILLVQDIRENRYQANFPHIDEQALRLGGNVVLLQKAFNRSFTQRPHKEALALVLDWVWSKAFALDVDAWPALPDINEVTSQAGFAQSCAIPLNKTYRRELVRLKQERNASRNNGRLK